MILANAQDATPANVRRFLLQHQVLDAKFLRDLSVRLGQSHPFSRPNIVHVDLHAGHPPSGQPDSYVLKIGRGSKELVFYQDLRPRLPGQSRPS
jgi:hypothetical protein